MASEFRDTICPECQVGKHQNCDGIAWDTVEDVQALCTCQARRHEPPKEPSGPDMDEVFTVTRAQLYAAACTRKETCGAHRDTVEKMLGRLGERS